MIAHLTIEEFSALRSSCLYLDPEARGDDGSAWHDLLDRTLHGLSEWDRTGCADGTQRLDVPILDDTDHSHRDRTIQADRALRDHDRRRTPHRRVRKTGGGTTACLTLTLL